MSDWNGEGLPPVGAVCKYSKQDHEYHEAGLKFDRGDVLEVLAHKVSEAGLDVVVVWNTNKLVASSRLVVHNGRQVIIPIRTAEEVAVEAMISVAKKSMGRFAEENRGDYTRIYRAICDGKIPGVKLED